MTDDTKTDASSESFDQVLESFSSDLFREQSGFPLLTPEQRLDWLDEMARFVCEFKGKAG